ncbi:MAG: adenylosuccinate synthetase [Sulfolobales archaeon]
MRDITPVTVVVGGFFGDEGKGKVVGYLGFNDKPAIAVRTGSINAGHTVSFSGKVWKLRVVPSAFLCRSCRLYVPAGALISIQVFLKEVSETECGDRIFLDYNTGIITEEHVMRENVDELMKHIGSTKQGVGAANSDRIMRRLKLAKDYEALKGYLRDVALEVNEYVDKGEYVLVEGTQGFYLSLYFGTYPFVTSRDTSASGVLSEAGIGPKKVDDVLVVFKSYVTRVGEGPLPQELNTEDVERLGLVERASVTGRIRRAAPFNIELAKKAVIINSATQVALTKIDVLFKDAYNVREWWKLPLSARVWIEEIENVLKVPITLIGTGEDVTAIIDRRKEIFGSMRR